MHLELVLLPEHSEDLADRLRLGIVKLLRIWVHVALTQVVCEMILPEFAAEGGGPNQNVDVPLLDRLGEEEPQERGLVVCRDFCIMRV